MRLDKIVLLIGFVALTGALEAQSRPAGPTDAVSRLEASLGYMYLHANAPPGACGCFSLNGGYGSVAVNATHGLSLVADMSFARAGNVAGTTQNVNLFNYLFGPRYSWRWHSDRWAPYGQVLLGGASEHSANGGPQSTSGFAISAGGGLDARLTRRFGWNVIEADWLHSQLANGANNRQNDLRISSGINVRF